MKPTLRMLCRLDPVQASTLLDFGTRKIFTAEDDALRSTVRKFFQEEVAPKHAKYEEANMVPKDVWLSAGKLGLLCPTIPEEFGGPGVPITTSAIIWEEQYYAQCTGLGFPIHSDIVAPYIFKHGTLEQKKKYLPKMCSGEYIAAIAMTEPSCGSDLKAIKTNAIKDKSTGEYVINGAKTFISNGFSCDVVLVVARTGSADSGAKGLSLLFVETQGTKGFTKGKPLRKMGLHAQDTCELFFDNVRVSGDAVLGGVEAKGFQQLMTELPTERLLIADTAVATSEACFEWTREYVKNRQAFGKRILDHQTVSHRLAEMKTEVSIHRTYVDHCIQMHHEKKLDTQMASMAKLSATNLAVKTTRECVQLHGGNGYMWEYKVCRAHADTMVQPIYGGANEIMKEVIARTL
eukprot:PhF_6_TR13190/c1_g2_i2/m.20828/K00255/ACADL; long-chain-acyl-CoA dehydrogenase